MNWAIFLWMAFHFILFFFVSNYMLGKWTFWRRMSIEGKLAFVVWPESFTLKYWNGSCLFQMTELKKKSSSYISFVVLRGSDQQAPVTTEGMRWLCCSARITGFSLVEYVMSFDCKASTNLNSLRKGQGRRVSPENSPTCVTVIG